jgi:radical SAM protein with 4Fe4S-binding SPASM domain
MKSAFEDRKPCFMLYSLVAIYWNGDIGLCCEDWFNEHNIGNVKGKSMLEVWNNENMQLIRELHEKNDYEKLNLCKECSSWLNDFPEIPVNDNIKMTTNSWQTIYERLR